MVMAGFAAPQPAGANAAAIAHRLGTPDGGDGGSAQVTTGDSRFLTAPTGNGTGNQNQPRIFSPTDNIGVQHISSVAKWFAVQAGYC